jgi:hypothetical protein
MHLIDCDFYTLPILCDSLDNILLSVIHVLCITDSVLSDKDGTDEKEK